MSAVQQKAVGVLLSVIVVLGLGTSVQAGYSLLVPQVSVNKIGDNITGVAVGDITIIDGANQTTFTGSGNVITSFMTSGLTLDAGASHSQHLSYIPSAGMGSISIGTIADMDQFLGADLLNFTVNLLNQTLGIVEMTGAFVVNSGQFAPNFGSSGAGLANAVVFSTVLPLAALDGNFTAEGNLSLDAVDPPGDNNSAAPEATAAMIWTFLIAGVVSCLGRRLR